MQVALASSVISKRDICRATCTIKGTVDACLAWPGTRLGLGQ